MHAKGILCTISAAFLMGCHSMEHRPIAPSSSGSDSVSDQNGSALIRHKTGNVQAKIGGVWSARANVGSVLCAGDEIRTGPNSSVDLDMGKSGGVIRLEPSTYVVVRKLSWRVENGELVSDTLLEVREGRVVGNSGKLTEKSVLEIKTPTSATRIR
jgi:hypothetical protein